MINVYKIRVTEDIDWNINDRKYSKGEELIVSKYNTKGLNTSYAYKEKDVLDWIPIQCAEIIEKLGEYTIQ